jgi:hypothetical protein
MTQRRRNALGPRSRWDESFRLHLCLSLLVSDRAFAFYLLPNTMVFRWALGVDHFQTWFAYLANGAELGFGVD